MSITKKPDAEMQQFMDDLEKSIRQAKRGEHALVHTLEQIMALRQAAVSVGRFVAGLRSR